MTKIVSDPEPFLQAILNKQNTILSSESTYLKVSLDYDNHGHNQAGLSTYLFSNPKQLYNYCDELSVVAKLLIQTLTPGPIQIVVNSKGKLGLEDKFIAYIPDNPKVLAMLNEFNKPLRAEFISPVSSVGIDDLNKFEGNNDFVVLEQDLIGVRVLPTLVDCTSAEIEIFRPGVISYDELRSIIPKKTKLKRNYISVKSELDLKIHEIAKIDQNDKQMSVVLGTKESLQEAFSLHYLDYFHHKQMGNFILFNIGSSTSSQNIAVNLHKNLEQVARFGVNRVHIIKQPWPKNKWGEIIRHYFNGLIIPHTPDDVSYQTVSSLNLVTA